MFQPCQEPYTAPSSSADVGEIPHDVGYTKEPLTGQGDAP
jgi:hypothetical protein